ncbi:MAG TPA: hypothetical protein VMV74_08895 [Bacteroidales bacterium]|nr:hypothetical protein [Bacteroidales bacterium]
MEVGTFSLGQVTDMSKATIYTSRRGKAACSDKDLYAFMTDMRNFGTIIPEGTVTEWQATEDNCSFRVDKAGKVTAGLSEALPYSRIDYFAETFITGRVSVTMNIEPDGVEQSLITLSVSAYLNPFVKLAIGDTAVKYLNEIISAFEKFGGYDRIRGYNQSL